MAVQIGNFWERERVCVCWNGSFKLFSVLYLHEGVGESTSYLDIKWKILSIIYYNFGAFFKKKIIFNLIKSFFKKKLGNKELKI